jgi:Fe2+ or Zn2+ uptake regulation protein
MGSLLSRATAALRANGGRMTAQRRLILETLDALGGHPTAEQVYNAARQRVPTINPSTVYRTLSWLADAGLVRPRQLRAGPGDRSERFEPSPRGEHFHFVCVGCGQVIEFESPEVERIRLQFCQQHQVVIERASLTFYGWCESCRGDRKAQGRVTIQAD